MMRKAARIALAAIAIFAIAGGALAVDFGCNITNVTTVTITTNAAMSSTSGNYVITTNTLAGGDALLVYTDTANPFTVNVEGQILARVLLVGGGGAGGAGGTSNSDAGGGGGGGGGGGFVETNAWCLASGTYTIAAGAGGSINTNAKGNNGNASYITNLTESVEVLCAKGGGGGGLGGTNGTAGEDGGCGGGGGASSGSGSRGGGSGAQGFAGGKSSNAQAGGGGGGAGEKGFDTTADKAGANGGDGKASDITGETVVYGGGGGGGANNTGSAGEGGAGGGGKGDSSSSATSGGKNLGGGGGGGGSMRARRAAAGGSGIAVIRVTRIYDLIEKPVSESDSYNVSYNGEEQHASFEPNEVYTLSGNYRGTDVADYSFKVTLFPGLRWSDGTDDEVTINWRILKAQSFVSNLVMHGWREGASKTSEPMCEHNPGAVVKYSYWTEKEGGTELTAKPTDPGMYWVYAAIENTPNYTAASAEERTSFTILADGQSPMSSLGNFADINFTNYTGAAQSWAWVDVEISSATVPGLDWNTVSNDLSDVRFCDVNGNVYSSEIKTLDYGGTSVFRVLLPFFDDATSLFVCWGPVDGEEVPEVPETTVAGTEVADSGISISSAQRDGSAKLANHWIVEPNIPTSWDVATPPTNEINAAEAAYSASGEPIFVISTLNGDEAWTNLHNGASSFPSAAGLYSGSFIVEATDSYARLEKRYPVITISGHSPQSSLKGDAEDLSSSGRVLLMNRDVNPLAPVENQGYADTINTTNATYRTYWKHLVTSSVSSVCNLKNSVKSELWSCAGSRLWTLEDCRHGNNFRTNRRFYSSENYLPFASTSRSITEHASDAQITMAGAGQVLMRNTTNSCVVSSCFKEGIGTIYFDAVNGGTSHFNDEQESFELTVWVATNCVHDASLPPTDENVFQVETNDVDGVAVVTTNEFGLADWQPVPMRPMIMDQSSEFAFLSETNTLALTIEHGGKTNNFYRIVVQLNYRCPARLKIQRVSIHPSFLAISQIDDYRALIVLDNIIASYPAMKVDLDTAGTWDESKTGKQILGFEDSFTEPYPSVHSEGVHGKAVSIAYTNAMAAVSDPDSFVVTARMNYRWRYLNQKTSEWQSVLLNPQDGYKSLMPLDLPSHICDIEYYYDVNLSAPYYEYVDYSGIGLGLSGLYSEEIPAVTNHCISASPLPSRGTDWFVRLREGRSEWSEVNLLVRREGSTAVATNAMELISDNVWRGCHQTLTNQTGTIQYRIAFADRRIEGEEFSPNSATYVGDLDSMNTPAMGKLVQVEEDGDEWSSFPVDAVTGYLMFQVDASHADAVPSLTVVHADYQNFNEWSDAHTADKKFVGHATDDESKTGTSPMKKLFLQDFDTWKNMSNTVTNWNLFSFADLSHLLGREAYVPRSGDTDRGWTIGPGMWVSKYYADSTAGSGVAYQMEGCGYGFLQYVNRDNAPRGLKTVSFNARLGQFIDPSRFSYYDGGSKSKMTNYTFVARGAFDLNRNQNFCGNGSLSVVAAYRPNMGCYEARFEQIGASRSGGKVNGYAPRGQRLSLYRWKPNASGRMEATLLVRAPANNVADIAAPSALNTSQSFMPIFISISNTVDGATIINAGVSPAGMTLVNNPNASTDWMGVRHTDSSADRLTSGTYGVLCANCEGVFANMVCYQGSAGFNTDGYYTSPNKISAFGSSTALKSPEYWYNQLEDWVYWPGTMKYVDHETNVRKSLQGDAAPASVTIYTAPAGTTDWTNRATIAVSSFGKPSAATNYSTNLYLTADCSVKIGVDGDRNDPRTDVVIDTVGLTQWRGDNYSHASSEILDCIPGWKDPYQESGYTNWIFTSAWITNKAVLLSAKRTASGGVSSIRSPYMDGWEFSNGTRRGIGLGMIAFDYHNAQSNACILVQVATNVNSSTLSSWDGKIDDWITVTNIDFSTVLASDRVRGTRSVYIGLHGVKGLMRLLVDPARVASVARVNDETAFGEVFIDKVICRDEPPLDSRSWWGWNMRTVGDNDDSEYRMFLPDLTADSTKVGLSAALNNSITADTDIADAQTYKQHVPFIQTPTFTNNIVGAVSFRARKYNLDPSGTAQPASVTLYGSFTGDSDGTWTVLTNFVVESDHYTPYSYTTDPGSGYSAFRLGVSGVAGVDGSGFVVPDGYAQAVRVLLEEVLVSEAVRTRMAFRNVGAFRTDMSGTEYVKNVPSRDEQPLCGEGWGVECEVYAAQLSDEIDLERTPTVVLHWFADKVPWGYQKWKDLTKAQGRNWALLAPAKGTNLIYRSSYVTAPDAVIPMSLDPGSVVQYMLEVRYYQKGSSTMVTNWLSRTEWQRPKWYRPINYNEDPRYGAGSEENFSAYNILDTVAPGWAWINEMNIHGSYDANWKNSEDDAQFVEIAVPVEANIKDWSVRFLCFSTTSDSDAIVTNTVGVFGTQDLPGMKPNNLGAESNMVFRVIACPKADGTDGADGTLKRSQGELDATWRFQNKTETFQPSGEIFSTDPFAVQLVRASGIVEHEIVCVGTNFYGSMPGLEQYYSPERTVEKFRRLQPECSMFYVGEDCRDKTSGGFFRSLSVVRSFGEDATCWTNTAVRTPGRINDGQSIDPDHPTPNGESVVVFCNLDTTFGHIRQTVGDLPETNVSQVVFVRKGSDRGTNIVYTVDPWYQLGSVTTNGQPAAWSADGVRRYVATVGKGASNSVTVVASAKIADALVHDYGLSPDNPYTPAVMQWLEGHTDLDGNPWANPDAEDIYLADLIRADDSVITNLDLTAMYWFDMDPTVSNLALKGYVASGPTFHDTTSAGGGALRNMRFDIFMQITNRTSGEAWSPYALRGLVPGSSSLAFAAPGVKSATGWNSVTFKIVGILDNGLTSMYSKRNWVPLRWFVFVPDSFGGPTDAKPFTSTIEIVDPFSPESPAATAGWYDWVQEHGMTPLGGAYSWRIDERLEPISVEVLRKENIYDD